jgi:cyclase
VLLRRVVPCLLTLLLNAGCAQHSGELPFTLTQVGPNVWAAIDNPKATSPAFANAGFVIGGDGVVVIDTFSNVDAARQLLAEIRTRTQLPVRFVVNTHYHEDHVAGNGTFADAGAAIVAQRNVRTWIHTENLRLLGPQITPEQKAQTDALVAPTIVFDGGLDLFLGSRDVRVRRFPGHTGGDAVVIVGDARVVFMGDLLFRDMFPTLIDASVDAWIETLGTLAAGQSGYTFVPGHGDIGSAQDVGAFREYLRTLRTLVSDARAQGRSGDALVAAVTAALRPRFGRWDYFDQVAKDNALQVEAELGGTKKIPRE